MSVKVQFCCPCGCKSEIVNQIVSGVISPMYLNCRRPLDPDVISGINQIIQGLALAGDQVALSPSKENH